MRNQQRNQRTLWYRLYQSVAPLTYTDEYGNVLENGENASGYGDPVEMRANISPATGSVLPEQFGRLEDYDRIVETADVSCPIDENSVLYIDTAPLQDLNTLEWSAHDYIVRRVAKSLNGVRIYVKKVDVS